MDYLAKIPASLRVQEVRRVMYHELMHWFHRDSPGAAGDIYRSAIRDHYAARTKGENPTMLPRGMLRRDDKWWNNYAGMQYPWEQSCSGLEVPTVYFELLANPNLMSLVMEQQSIMGRSKEFHDSLKVVIGGLFP